MASEPLELIATTEPVPTWRAPKVLLDAAVRSSSLLPHDLVNRFTRERFQFFLSGFMAMYGGAGVLLPMWEYLWVLRAGWLLALAAICSGQCLVLAAALRLAARGRHGLSISVACIGNWCAVLLVTLVSPNVLPLMVVTALLPVVFAQPYIRWQLGLAFAVITAVCVLGLVALARFEHIAHMAVEPPRWIETALIMVGLPGVAFHLLVIAFNNAGALAVSEQKLAKRAAEVEASRGRLVTAADEERRRLERNLHDGAQQHLVALAVIIQLARAAENRERQALLAEASGLLDTAIADIRRLAHGIYPQSLISGGLAQALSTVAAHAPIPIRLELHRLGRYPASVEAALYFCCSEALQNATKHGGPGTSVTVAAHTDARALTLTISDTGCGFEPTTAGTGLTNMTDRVSAIGGKLVIDTAPGRGTRVSAVVEAPQLKMQEDF